MMQVIGHRGSAGTSPENTLFSIQEALDCGAAWIEIDVRYVDNQLFVIHDEQLARTTNGHGSIYALSGAEIATLDAGNQQRIPTLSEVIALIDGKAGLNIELKDCASLSSTIELVRDTLERGQHWRDKFMVSTFEQSIHGELANLIPESCRFGLLSQTLNDDIIDYALDLNAYSLNLSFAQLSRPLVQKAHAVGLKVFVYTVNHFADIDKCLSDAVDAIYTDYPARTISYLHTPTNPVLD